jgi:hypothetical protein
MQIVSNEHMQNCFEHVLGSLCWVAYCVHMKATGKYHAISRGEEGAGNQDATEDPVDGKGGGSKHAVHATHPELFEPPPWLVEDKPKASIYELFGASFSALNAFSSAPMRRTPSPPPELEPMSRAKLMNQTAKEHFQPGNHYSYLMSEQAELLFEPIRQREHAINSSAEQHDTFDEFKPATGLWSFSFSESDVQDAVAKAEEEASRDIEAENLARRRESQQQRRRASNSLMKRLEKDLNRGHAFSKAHKDDAAFQFLEDIDQEYAAHAFMNLGRGVKADVTPIDMWHAWEYVHSQCIKRGVGGQPGPGATFQLLQWTLNTQEDDLFDFSHPFMKDFLVGEYLFRRCGFGPGTDGMNFGSEGGHYQYSHGANSFNRFQYDQQMGMTRRMDSTMVDKVTETQLGNVGRVRDVLSRLLSAIHGEGSQTSHRRNIQLALFEHPEHFMLVQMVQQLFRHIPIPAPIPKDALTDGSDDLDFVAEVLKKNPNDDEVDALYAVSTHIKRIRCGLYASVAVADVTLGLGDCAYALTDESAIDVAAAGHHADSNIEYSVVVDTEQTWGDDGSLGTDGMGGSVQHHFSVAGQQMGAAALWTLSTVLQGNSSLQVLDLSGCSMDACTTLSFANAMFYCSTEAVVTSHIDEMLCKKTTLQHFKSGAKGLSKLLPLLELVAGGDGDRTAASKKNSNHHTKNAADTVGDSTSSPSLTKRSEYLTLVPPHTVFPALHTLRVPSNPLTDAGARKDGITALIRCLFATKNRAEPMSYALPDCSNLEQDPEGMFPIMGGELCICTPCLCELDLTDTGLDAEMLQFLAESILSAAKDCPSGPEAYPMRVLRLGGNCVTIKAVVGVGFSDKKGKKKLEHDYIGLETLMKMLKLVPVERLRLENNGIDPEGLATIAEGLSFKQRLREIVLNHNLLLGRTSTMKEAKGATTKADCTGLTQFISSLSSSSSRILSLEGCNLGTEGAATIGKNIVTKGVGLLTCLDLSGNGIGPKGVKCLFDALMSFNPDKSAKSGAGLLHTLDLSRNELGPEGARAIATATKATKGHGGLRGLRSLGLAFNDLVGRGGQFSQLVSTHCQDFDALGELVQSFAGAGCAWKQLEHVDLSQNRMGYEGALMLAQEPVARVLGSLLSVDLSDNEFFDQGSVILAQGLHHVHTLMINDHFEKEYKAEQHAARIAQMGGGKGALKGILRGAGKTVGVWGSKIRAPKHEEEATEAPTEALVLTVKVVQATGLPGVDSSGLSDPYVKLSVNGVAGEDGKIRGKDKLVNGGLIMPATGRTRVFTKTTSPKFNETFDLAVTDLSKPLKLVVMDYDLHGGDDLMCDVDIDLRELEVGVARNRDWYRLGVGVQKQLAGRIEIDLELHTASDLVKSKDIYGITLVRGEDLAQADDCGGSDPYCVVTFNNFQVGTTKVVTNDLNPEWGHSLEVPWCHSSASMQYEMAFEVYDQDLEAGNKDDFLGGVYLTAQELLQYGDSTEPIAFELQKKRLKGKRASVVGAQPLSAAAPTPKVAKSKKKGHKKTSRPESGKHRLVQGKIWLQLRPPAFEESEHMGRWVIVCVQPTVCEMRLHTRMNLLYCMYVGLCMFIINKSLPLIVYAVAAQI